MKYRISDLAKILDVSTNTIRRYEKSGYITSVKDGDSKYKYYTEEDVFGLINTRLLRKYGFSHDELEQMKTFNLSDTIEAYQKRMEEMDEQIAYMTYVRHRIKDDVLLMKKAEVMDETGVYEKYSVEMVYVLYKENDKILTEPKRLEKINEFMYISPEVQRVYIMRKHDFENGEFIVNMGWAIKEMHMDKYSMTENEYTEMYGEKRSIMGMIKIPVNVLTDNKLSVEDVKKTILNKHIAYIDEHNLRISDDIIGMVVSSAVEDGINVQYILVSIPVENKG